MLVSKPQKLLQIIAKRVHTLSKAYVIKHFLQGGQVGEERISLYFFILNEIKNTALSPP